LTHQILYISDTQFLKKMENSLALLLGPICNIFPHVISLSTAVIRSLILWTISDSLGLQRQQSSHLCAKMCDDDNDDDFGS